MGRTAKISHRNNRTSHYLLEKMQKNNLFKLNSHGFTLVEIVMVLVLIGILSAVVVPKYFDLEEQAEKAAVKAVVAEFYARSNAGLAQGLLSGDECGSAGGQAMLDAALEINREQGKYEIQTNHKNGSEYWLEVYLKNEAAGAALLYQETLVTPDCQK